jgi:peptide-methionine (S)-S-oxide reductase
MLSSVKMVTSEQALAGRDEPIVITDAHLLYGNDLTVVPAGCDVAYFGMGCFWGAEKSFWPLDGVVTTAVGYQGGFTKNPTYKEVCSGQTGHTEIVKVVFDPTRISFSTLVAHMLEHHDPTQGFRQGADVGTQYRSAIYCMSDEQIQIAHEVASTYQTALSANGYGNITTEIKAAGPFYLAEDYHQQYLIANPNGYCGLGGTGVSCPVGLAF